MGKSLVVFWAVLLLSGLSAFRTYGGTITAQSSGRADVQAAIDTAIDGDTIVVPGGTSTWTQSVLIQKQITLKGSGADVTIIKCHVSFPGAAIMISPKTDNVRITGFTFDGDVWSDANPAVRVSTFNQNDGCHNFRIDHNKFRDFRYTTVTGTSAWVIRLYGFNYGVIDHNVFTDCMGENIYNAADGTEAYSRSTDLGQYTNGTVFIEDNEFVLTGVDPGKYAANAVDMNEGARTVFRFNTIRDPGTTWWVQPVETHGFFVCDNECYPKDLRGTLSIEIYGNTFDTKASMSGQWNRALNLRGGKGVIFNNQFLGRWEVVLYLVEYRSCALGLDGQVNQISPPYPKYELQAHVDTDSGGPLINEGLVSGNLVYGVLRDQINDLYVWNNTLNGNPIAADVADIGYNKLDIVEGRNYYMQQMSDYMPYPYPHPLVVQQDTAGSPGAPSRLRLK